MAPIDDIAASISDLMSGEHFDPRNDTGEAEILGFPLDSARLVEVGTNPATGPFLSLVENYAQWSATRRETVFEQLLRLSAERRFADGWFGSLAPNESVRLTRPIPPNCGEREVAASIGRAIELLSDQPSTNLEAVSTDWLRV